jgi:hypothetical protein
MSFIPDYQPARKYGYWELRNTHPEWSQLLDQQNAWAQYEQKPNLAGLPPEVVKMIPQTVRDGKDDDRIDAWIL